MDHSQSSFELHRTIEPLGTFCRREWRAIAAFGGAFCVVTLAGVFLLDPAFFYPRLQTDPLNYWLKARELVENGNTSARWAVNIAPFSYAAMPGVLRAPILMIFRDFDQQLRGMQILNIPIVAGVALLSAYAASWIQPAGRHKWVIAFSFAFTLLSPVWIANVLLPLADAPYALATLGSVILAVRIICNDRPLMSQLPALTGWIALFVVSFLLRYTAPVLLLFVAALLRGKWRSGKIPAKRIATGIAASTLALALLVALNADAIFGRYLGEPFFYLRNASKLGILLNFFGAALPAQVIPNFIQGFVVPPVGEYYKTNFFTNAADTAWLGVGIAISAVVVTGMWTARSRFLPEILYLLAPLPVLALMLPSTARYLMTYQAFVWVFFYMGAACVYRSARPRIPGSMRNRGFAAVALTAAVFVVVGIRAWRFAGTGTERMFAVGIARAPEYAADVTIAFRGLREYLESLPGDRALLVSDRGSMGRWKIIANRDYYDPDSATSRVANEKELYLLVECGTMEGCQRWDWWRSQVEERLSDFGRFAYDSVYAITRPRARAEVFRIRNAM